MSQVVTVQIRDELYTVLSRQAEIAGLSLPEWIAVALEQTAVVSERPNRTEAEKESARQRFRRHAGSIDWGHPTGADNQSIDADLIRAYSDDFN